jgi:hypothetical protein
MQENARTYIQLAALERSVISVKWRKWLCKMFLIPGDWFQPINSLCLRTVHGMPKVPILLQAQPEIC